MTILSIEHLSKRFEGVTALEDVGLDVRQGEIRGIIGPNGSGKTTLVNLISGLLIPSQGEIYLDGEMITGCRAHVINRKGVARTFQIPKILPDLTCLQNVMVGCHQRYGFDLFGTWLRMPFTASRQEREIQQEALGVLDFMGLGQAAERMGSELSWVEEQLVQISRALASEPRLLLLDEPTAGMGETESQDVQDAIKRIQHRGVTTIVVAHDMKLISRIAEQVTCLSFGTKIADGRTDAVLSDPKVLEVYLGSD